MQPKKKQKTKTCWLQFEDIHIKKKVILSIKKKYDDFTLNLFKITLVSWNIE